MGKKLTAYDAAGYVLSCGHAPAILRDRIANTAFCVACRHRYFILDVLYERPPAEES